jgi:hypothetical protein
MEAAARLLDPSWMPWTLEQHPNALDPTTFPNMTMDGWYKSELQIVAF